MEVKYSAAMFEAELDGIIRGRREVFSQLLSFGHMQAIRDIWGENAIRETKLENERYYTIEAKPY